MLNNTIHPVFRTAKINLPPIEHLDQEEKVVQETALH